MGSNRIQTELTDMCSLSFVNSTFFTTYLVTNSHWRREDPEQEWHKSEKWSASWLGFTVPLLVTW